MLTQGSSGCVILNGEKRESDTGRQFPVSLILPHPTVSTILYYDTFFNEQCIRGCLQFAQGKKLQRWNSNSDPSASKPIFILLHHVPCTQLILLQQTRHIIKNTTHAMWPFLKANVF